jgi:hypothetical protein
MENLKNFTYKLLLKELQILEHKAIVYSQMWGNDSEEVKQLDKKIIDLNLQVLDIMDKDITL